MVSTCIITVHINGIELYMSKSYCNAPEIKKRNCDLYVLVTISIFRHWYLFPSFVSQTPLMEMGNKNPPCHKVLRLGGKNIIVLVGTRYHCHCLGESICYFFVSTIRFHFLLGRDFKILISMRREIFSLLI